MFTAWNSSLLCFAHSKGVRVVTSAAYPVSDLENATQRSVWVQQQLTTVKENFADGINVDIEEPIDGTSQAALLTQLMSELYSTFKTADSDYQVTFDVAWSPNCTDGRCYQYDQLAKFTDFLVIMAYDERSQVYGPCIASANSAFATTAKGIQQYLNLGITAGQLVLGLPWYGYDYPCVEISSDRKTCTIRHVPFRGVNCSDAAGEQVAYADIIDLTRQHTVTVQWDEVLESPYFVYKNPSDVQLHQVGCCGQVW